MFKIIFALMVTMAGVYAVESSALKHGCTLQQEGPLKVTWGAYKTAAKAKVSGTFDKVAFTPTAASGANFHEIFVGSSVVIDTASVNTNHAERDATLVKYFFTQMSGNTITAKIVSMTSNKHEKGKAKTGTFMTEVTMNGMHQTVPMTFHYEKGVLQAEGVIDLFDFSANKALSAINKACYDLHEGKTWNDVVIGFSTNIVATLCASNTKQ